tara:strand:- start:264 stop:701 length:438 start_codon:yes stop_codon:yes gene_type:complete
MPFISVEKKKQKLINSIVEQAIANVLRKVRFSDHNRYLRYSGMNLVDGVSSTKNLLEHFKILINMMKLPDNLTEDQPSGCPYGCSNPDFCVEQNMITRVEGLKIAITILINNFNKDDHMEDTTGYIMNFGNNNMQYEDPLWCINI